MLCLTLLRFSYLQSETSIPCQTLQQRMVQVRMSLLGCLTLNWFLSLSASLLLFCLSVQRSSLSQVLMQSLSS